MKNNSELSIQQRHGDWWLCEEGEYPRNSVLAGQYRFTLLTHYDSLEEAIADNPNVRVTDSSLPSWFTAPSLDLPYDGFDEADCGEKWDDD